MKIFGFGVYENVQSQVDKTHAAMRVSVRPAEKGVLGSYSVGLVSGVMAAGLAAGSPIFAFRWGAGASNALVRRVRLTAGTDATAFVQGATIFDLIRATGFTVQDTGGAAISLAAKSQARSSRFGASQIQIASSAVGNIAIAGTATLVAGTRALDSNPMSVLVGSVGAVPANFPLSSNGLLIDPAEAGRDPLELVNSEGFVIRATVPITGTWRFGVEVDWDEVDPARYFGNY